MARKVFISFLGYSNYGHCHYTKGEFKSDDIRYIQEATLDYLNEQESWGENDVAYILLTKGAKEKNWEDNGHTNPATKQPIIQSGLRECLQQKKYPFKIETIENLPDGNNETEIFSIFSQIYEVLESGDQLFFDITHGFRYLPMLVLVLENYSKFMKHITVKSITYGNYESRREVGRTSDDKPILEAPIIDLLPLSLIQDWTFAMADFLENSNVRKIKELTKKHVGEIFQGKRSEDTDFAKVLGRLVSMLEETIEDFQTCRGMNIINMPVIDKNKKGKRKSPCNHIKTIKESCQQLHEMGKTSVIEPINELLKKLEEAFAPFTNGNDCQISDGFIAAKWCYEHHLYQQATTILQENVVSFFCDRHKIDLDNENQRELVNKAFFIKAKDITSDKWEVASEQREKLSELLDDELLADREIINAFDSLKTVRNDINHNGMRSKEPPLASSNIRSNIEKSLNVITSKFIQNA